MPVASPASSRSTDPSTSTQPRNAIAIRPAATRPKRDGPVRILHPDGHPDPDRDGERDRRQRPAGVSGGLEEEVHDADPGTLGDGDEGRPGEPGERLGEATKGGPRAIDHQTSSSWVDVAHAPSRRAARALTPAPRARAARSADSAP